LARLIDEAARHANRHFGAPHKGVEFALDGQADKRELPSVGRLAAMHCAAVGEEAVLLRVRVEAEAFDHGHAHRVEPCLDVAFEIELPVPLAAGAKKRPSPGVKRARNASSTS
jgi:hypothetical protein